MLQGLNPQRHSQPTGAQKPERNWSISPHRSCTDGPFGREVFGVEKAVEKGQKARSSGQRNGARLALSGALFRHPIRRIWAYTTDPV